jgi:uncharacterized MnhB-related membrane protein
MAFLAINSNNLMRAIILLSSFSVLCSIAYFLLHAPDVAIAEAVIGCSLSTILFLVALRKYRIFTVYIVLNEEIDGSAKFKIERNIIKYVKTINHEANYILTKEPVEKIVSKYKFDSVLVCNGDDIVFHGYDSNYHFDLMCEFFKENSDFKVATRYINEPEMELVK